MFNGVSRGLDVFKEFSNSLVCFVIMTGSIERITPRQYMDLVNNHAWYIVQRDQPVKEIMSKIRDTESHLLTRIDIALEQWIVRHKKFKREEPYLRFSDGKTMTLNEILREIRCGTDFGNQMQQSIINVAISGIYKDIDKLENDNNSNQ